MSSDRSPFRNRESVQFYSEWLYRAILFLLIVAGLYLNSRYATKEQFDVLSGRVTKAEEVMQIMVEKNTINDRQDLVLSDHEKRIRDLEFRRTTNQRPVSNIP
jgi:hypothetical protein